MRRLPARRLTESAAARVRHRRTRPNPQRVNPRGSDPPAKPGQRCERLAGRLRRGRMGSEGRLRVAPDAPWRRRIHPVTDGRAEKDALREIERGRLRALVAGDIDGAQALHADDFQLINPAGGALSKQEYLDLISSGAFRYRLWEPQPIAVRLYGGSAVVRYRAEIEAIFDGTTTRRVTVNRMVEPKKGRRG
jgi:hypothetical protein